MARARNDGDGGCQLELLTLAVSVSPLPVGFVPCVSCVPCVPVDFPLTRMPAMTQTTNKIVKMTMPAATMGLKPVLPTAGSAEVVDDAMTRRRRTPGLGTSERVVNPEMVDKISQTCIFGVASAHKDERTILVYVYRSLAKSHELWVQAGNGVRLSNEVEEP